MKSKTQGYKGMSVTFQVTEDCNLRCKYCYELDKRPGDLPLEYAKSFIDIILSDPDPINAIGTDKEWILNQGLILDFIGGDALMKPLLLDEIIKYYMFRSNMIGHKWANRWRIALSTNGTLFGNPDVRYFCEKYKSNLSLGISIDGCPEIHDMNRIYKDNRGTMKDIVKYWDYYKTIETGNLKTKSTCNKESIPYLFKSVKFLYEELGINEIFMNFVFEDLQLTNDDLIELEKQLEMIVDYILIHKNEIYFSMLSREFGIGDNMKEDQLETSWCGSGAMPTLSINGKIYPCFRFAPNTMSTRNYDFNVGDVWSGLNKKYNFELVRQQTRGKISPLKCRECDTETTCAWCIGGSYAEKGEFYRQTYICDIKKVINKWSRIYWDEFDKTENKNTISI